MFAYALIKNILYAPHQYNFSNNQYCIVNSFVTETTSLGERETQLLQMWNEVQETSLNYASFSFTV